MVLPSNIGQNCKDITVKGMVGKRQKSSRNPSLTLNVLVPEVELVWLWFSKGSFHPLSFGSISLMSQATVSTHSFLGLLQDHDPLGTTFHCLSCFSASNNENTVLLNPQSVSVVSFFLQSSFFLFCIYLWFVHWLCLHSKCNSFSWILKVWVMSGLQTRPWCRASQEVSSKHLTFS